jgi:hypothetical protein
MRKEITRSKYLLMTWSLIGIGLLLNAGLYTYLVYTKGNLYLNEASMGIGVVLGLGLGYAFSRTWKIIDFD